MAALEAENELMDLEYNEDEDSQEEEHDLSVNESAQISEKKVEVVTKSLELLYKEYSSKSSESSSRFPRKTPHELLTESPLDDDFDDDLLELERYIQFGDIEEYFDYDDEDANKRASSGVDSGVEVETSVRDLESGALLYMTY
ncbi:hypothetical protein YC2023_018997 [Brassica napus]